MTLYPSYPDHRMAYHLDGTQVYRVSSSNIVTTVSSTEVQYLNNESPRPTEAVSLAPGYLVFIFPQLRDISTYLYIGTGNTSGSDAIRGVLQKSTDTTNGVDGTWTTVSSNFTQAYSWYQYTSVGPVSPYYRSSIPSMSAINGVKALRFESAQYFYGDSLAIGALHLFGNLTSGETPNRLELWHPTSNARVSASHFDFEDKYRSTTTDISFRVKNQSSTQTANSIAVSMATLTDSSPTAIGNYTLNLNGGSFASTQTISSLAPGAISNILTLRLTNPSDAALSLWAGTVKALATSWT